MDLGPSVRANPRTSQLGRWRALQAAGGAAPPEPSPVTRPWDQALMDRVVEENKGKPLQGASYYDPKMAALRTAHLAERKRIVDNRNAMLQNVRAGNAPDHDIYHPKGTTVADLWRGLPPPHAAPAALAQPVANAVAPMAQMLANALPGGGPLAAIITAIHAAAPQAQQYLGGLLGQGG